MRCSRRQTFVQLRAVVQLKPHTSTTLPSAKFQEGALSSIVHCKFSSSRWPASRAQLLDFDLPTVRTPATRLALRRAAERDFAAEERGTSVDQAPSARLAQASSSSDRTTRLSTLLDDALPSTEEVHSTSRRVDPVPARSELGRGSTLMRGHGLLAIQSKQVGVIVAGQMGAGLAKCPPGPAWTSSPTNPRIADHSGARPHPLVARSAVERGKVHRRGERTAALAKFVSPPPADLRRRWSSHRSSRTTALGQDLCRTRQALITDPNAGGRRTLRIPSINRCATHIMVGARCTLQSGCRCCLWSNFHHASCPPTGVRARTFASTCLARRFCACPTVRLRLHIPCLFRSWVGHPDGEAGFCDGRGCRQAVVAVCRIHGAALLSDLVGLDT